MSAWDLLRLLVCKPAPRTDASTLIAQAEVTRLELAELTKRLSAHVLALQTLTRRYTDEHDQEGKP